MLLARSPAEMSLYFDACYIEFDHILVASTSISQNGDDAIELFMDSIVVETFGDINVDGSGEPWEYLDSWAYKDTSGLVPFSGGNWIFGGVNCSDGSTTTYSSSCPYPICPPLPNIGCTDSTALNYDPLATTDDGSCLYQLGCTDSTALNFDLSAIVDDGSCLYPVSGCTDSSATNYNSLATTAVSYTHLRAHET